MRCIELRIEACLFFNSRALLLQQRSDIAGPCCFRCHPRRHRASAAAARRRRAPRARAGFALKRAYRYREV
jgi:hypothetical protein